jgi:hypothetical protein
MCLKKQKSALNSTDVFLLWYFHPYIQARNNIFLSNFSENIPKYSVTPCVFNIWDIWGNPKERSEASYLKFLFWWNSLDRLRQNTGRYIEKLS